MKGRDQAAAEIMGHLNGLKIYLRHYRAVRSPEEARDYFAIRPEAGPPARSRPQ